jgi:hypothetical protein
MQIVLPNLLWIVLGGGIIAFIYLGAKKYWIGYRFW